MYNDMIAYHTADLEYTTAKMQKQCERMMRIDAPLTEQEMFDMRINALMIRSQVASLKAEVVKKANMEKRKRFRRK